MNKKTKYSLLVILGLLVIVSIISSLYRERLPYIYLLISNGKSFEYKDKQYQLNDGFFFIDNSEKDFSYIITSPHYEDKEAIVVFFPEKIDFKTLIANSMIVEQKKITEECVLFKAIGSDSEYLINLTKNEAILSITDEYLKTDILQSLCTIIKS